MFQSLKLSQQLFLVVDLITVTPSFLISPVKTLLNFNASRIVWQW
ncbi:hypothetical protein NP493_75g03021 [Ridgeia piscesae]|uniref:Uncharacterized protein n=1 Tax=Ridgeia piscesae TaxID=27915 RepID=A0AAD9P9F6_RIDPI|nr:hypothetical protein NP493_75g03021 [Ridgeia piscesae]